MGALQRKLDPSQVRAIIDHAIAAGADSYIRDCEARIPEFVQRHYSWRGARKLHAHALGWDMLRIPLNILWSVVNLVLALLGVVAGWLGFKRLKGWIGRIPPGLETDMDRQISWLIVTELLQLPYAQGEKVSEHDALMAATFKDPALQALLNEVLAPFETPAQSAEFRARLDAKLAEYGATRTASAELASNTALLVTSKLALGKASFGALSAGSAISASVAHFAAVSNFWLGSAAGSYYYALFPVAASMRLSIAVTVVLVIVLALVSTFIGMLVDPLQARLGLHQRRLRKLLAAIGDDLKGQQDPRFQLREKYAARLFDIVDVLSSVGRTI